MALKVKTVCEPTDEQQQWLSEQLAQASNDAQPNKCVHLFGPGPEGKRCKECQLFIRKTGYRKTYFKCELRGDTNGPGTDHRANWQACGRFIENETI